jgi:hypothetical protein
MSESHTDNNIAEFVLNASPGIETLICEKFEAGILWLAARYNLPNVKACLNAIVSDSVAVIRDRRITSDSEIPPVIREQFHQYCARCPEAISTRCAGDLDTIEKAAAAIAVPFEKCSLVERDVLSLFYLYGLHEIDICRYLKLSVQRVRLIRKTARQETAQALAKVKAALAISKKLPGSEAPITARAEAV